MNNSSFPRSAWERTSGTLRVPSSPILFRRFPLLPRYICRDGEKPTHEHGGMEPDVDWRNGNPAAFEMLVRRWQQPVARFLFHLIGREEPLADLCQEVFLRVYENRGRYRETGTFSAWLYRITLNVARDAQRRRRKEPCGLGDAEPAAVEPSPDTVCEQAERGRLVVQAIADLPEPQRIVVVLRHYEEMSFEQIARMLGAPASTIKSRFSAALQRLRERLRYLCDDLTEPER